MMAHEIVESGSAMHNLRKKTRSFANKAGTDVGNHSLRIECIRLACMHIAAGHLNLHALDIELFDCMNLDSEPIQITYNFRI